MFRSKVLCIELTAGGKEALENTNPPVPRRNFLIVQEIQRGNVYQILTKFYPLL